MNQEIFKVKLPRELSYEELLKKCASLVGGVYVYTGRILKGGNESEQREIISTQATILCSDITNHFYDLTIEQIDQTFYWGCRGKFGEVMEISNYVFTKWLTEYKRLKINPTGSARITSTSAPVELPEQRRIQISNEQLTDAEAWFKSKGNFVTYIGIRSLYDNHVKRGNIKQDAFEEFRPNAKVLLQSEYNFKRIESGSLSEMKSWMYKAESLSVDGDDVKTEAIRICIEKYYKTLNEKL